MTPQTIPEWRDLDERVFREEITAHDRPGAASPAAIAGCTSIQSGYVNRFVESIP